MPCERNSAQFQVVLPNPSGGVVALSDAVNSARNDMLPETCTSVHTKGETGKVKIWVSTTGPWMEFQFCDENGTPPQDEMPFTLDLDYRLP